MLRRKFLIIAALLPLLAACHTQADSKGVISDTTDAKQLSAAESAFGEKSAIIMGLIPAENNQEMARKFEPMRSYLQKKLNRPVKVFQATDYAGVIEAMKKGRVDIAWYGPLSYVLAEKEAGAEAFAVGVLSNGKSTYKSLFVVPGNSSVKSLQDLKGKSVAFVDPASTSGALIPTYLIKKATGQLPQQFFGKLIYAGSHDAAELAVKNKTVDAAADDDITYENMLSKNLITKDSNRVLTESEPLPGSPLTYRKDLDQNTKEKIKDAILNAHKDIKVTGYGEIIRYDPATSADYQKIRDIVKQLGLKREQILK
jgi:phosphonate transport system substrate-binding protein